MYMIVRCALCALAMTIPAVAEWRRYVGTMKGDGVDSPPARSLGYLVCQPYSRTSKADDYFRCDEQQTHTRLRFVGRAGAFDIYELTYFNVTDDYDSSQPGLRSVLVRTAPDQYREIHLRENTNSGILFPPEIVHAGTQPLVRLKFDDGGIYHYVHEDYFVISAGGEILLDYGPLVDAASRVLPSSEELYQPTIRFDFASLLFHIGTEKRDRGMGPKVSCCVGRVEVPFVIQEGRVIAGEGKYSPQ
jgi:hypothetical protein